MAATAKHFPGHGAVAPDSHVAMPVDRRPLADLDEDLYPYRRLIDNGLAAVMAAHVIFERGRRPACRVFLTLDPGGAARPIWGSTAPSSPTTCRWRVRRWSATWRSAPQAALAAGCDVLSLCNDRQGVLQVIDSLRGSGDPLSQVRMVRLHGKPGPTRDALHASTEWQACEGAVKGCMERPDLQAGFVNMSVDARRKR